MTYFITLYSDYSMIQASCRKLYGWLKLAPYQADIADDDDDDFDTSQGLRVLGIVCSMFR